jgi:eukaryotic-like serine/threonine-protein kinase
MTTTQRWSRVSRILSEALDLPEADQAAFLAEAALREPALRTDVFALYEELRRTDEFLEQPTAMAREAAAPSEAFGSYRVIGELGEGGMGVVYLAERDDGQFVRRVAIKRVEGAGLGPDVLRRVRDEREILARLDHPNIARLLDAGLDDGGVPYLVMEHVEGLPFMACCRERALGVPERLALFLKVCAAVQHAHQHLVVHRDIKPDNILVTPEGEPKLLDFGIAKLLGDGPAPEATRTLHPALTLDYASPEQVRGDPVTTASDVYSLGVLLYELLAEVKPYEVSGRSLTEVVRLVCEAVPPPPSAKAAPPRRSELTGDLDSIAAKALEKAPADRYGSVAELAADVAAHLAHLPVKARRPSFAYVGRKFVRRHRTGAGVAALALVGLGAAVGAVVRQGRIAERERALAQQRFEQVRQLAHYVIFDLQDGIAKLPGVTTLRRQMVERSLAYLDSLATGQTANDPALQMELAAAYQRLGDVLGRIGDANLGDRAGALASYGKARKLLEAVVARHPQQADARRQLGRLLLSLDTAQGFDDPKTGTALVERATALWEGLVQEDPVNEDNLRGLASAHFSASMRSPEADRGKVVHMQAALETFEKLLAAKPVDPDRQRNVALCHKYLGTHFFYRDLVPAYEHTRRAVELDSARFAADPHNAQAKMDYTIAVGMLADIHAQREEYDEALQQYQKALALRRELYDADPANAHGRRYLARSLVKVACMHVIAGRPGLAAPLLEETITLSRTLDRTSAQDLWAPGMASLLRGEVALAAHRDPCPAYRRMAELAPDGPRLDGFPDALVKMRDRALARLKACPASGT